MASSRWQSSLKAYFSETSTFSLIWFLIVSAAVRNYRSESNNTEPHTENTTFYQNQEDLSTVSSREDTMVQTFRMSHISSEAPENLTVLTETASAEGRNESSRSTNFTILPFGHSSEITTTLTSHGSTLREFV